MKLYHYAFISSQNRFEKDEKMRKQKLSLRSVPTQREIENSKKIAIKLKKLKIYHYGFISILNRLENAKKEKK